MKRLWSCSSRNGEGTSPLWLLWRTCEQHPAVPALGLLRDTFVFPLFQEWLMPASLTRVFPGKSAHLFALFPWQGWGSADSGLGRQCWLLLCWCWGAGKGRAVGMCLADSALQTGEDAQGSPKAFHSISEHPCHQQRGWTTAGTKEGGSDVALPLPYTRSDLFLRVWIFQKCLKHLKELLCLSLAPAAGSH